MTEFFCPEKLLQSEADRLGPLAGRAEAPQAGGMTETLTS